MSLHDYQDDSTSNWCHEGDCQECSARGSMAPGYRGDDSRVSPIRCHHACHDDEWDAADRLIAAMNEPPC